MDVVGSANLIVSWIVKIFIPISDFYSQLIASIYLIFDYALCIKSHVKHFSSEIFLCERILNEHSLLTLKGNVRDRH